MKKIALIHYSSPPVIGGVEFVLEAQIRFFLEKGFRVKLITGKGEKLFSNLEFTLIPEMYSLHPKVIETQESLKKGNREEFERLKKFLIKRLEEALEDYEYIIAHNLFSMPFNIALTAACHEISQRKYFLAWIHDSPFFDPTYKQLLSSINPDQYPWNLLKTYSPQITYITISNARKEKLVNVLKFPEEKIYVIPNGVDVCRLLKLHEEAKRIFEFYNLYNKDWVGLFPARLIKRKNVELAIRIIAELKKMNFNVALIITGPPDPHRKGGEYLKELKKLAENTGVGKDIIFLCEYKEGNGFFRVSFDLLRSLYLLSDFLLITSYQEGFGIPVLEGGIFRLPIFASNIPTLKEIGREDVIFFSLEDPPSLIANKIQSTLKSYQFLRLFHRVVRKYDWNLIFENYLMPILKNLNFS